MANQLLTPSWITRDALAMLSAPAPRLFNPAPPTVLLGSRGGAPIYGPIVPALSSRALLALGATAVIASPRKISRRALLALGWKSR